MGPVKRQPPKAHTARAGATETSQRQRKSEPTQRRQSTNDQQARVTAAVGKLRLGPQRPIQLQNQSYYQAAHTPQCDRLANTP